MINLTQRQATIKDVPFIVQLLAEDELGQTREVPSSSINARYLDAFKKIDSDPHQYLMVVY